MIRLCCAFIQGLMIFWPLMVFATLRAGYLEVFLVVSLVLLLTRALLVGLNKKALTTDVVASCVGGILMGAALFFEIDELAFWYPVLVNLVLGLTFTFSLFEEKTIIQKFAELQINPLPPEGVRYTRNVTKLWIVFFVLNGLAAVATVIYGDLSVWTLYNGCISYVLIGLLFAGEFIYRKKIKHV